MNDFISIIIPNRNGSVTIGRCLESIFSSDYDRFEVIVIDDCSDDESIEIIQKFPCRLIRLDKHSGASKARNAGALVSRGQDLFFTDADCLMERNTLSILSTTMAGQGPDTIIGGTYTRIPQDPGFFSLFQSVFINYFETKHAGNPDYVATHALAINAGTFRKSGGFPEDFLPIIEDVEFSHRLRRAGYRLVMDPAIQVRHIFNFTFRSSLRNALKKPRYWTQYSLANKDLLVDSGTASRELKVNVLSCFFCLVFLGLWLFARQSPFLYSLPMIISANIFANRLLIRAFSDTKGTFFAFFASIYYTTLYAFAVGVGAMLGMAEYFIK